MTITRPPGGGDLACAAESIIASFDEERLADARSAGWHRRQATIAHRRAAITAAAKAGAAEAAIARNARINAIR